jgi:hypothetical protein
LKRLKKLKQSILSPARAACLACAALLASAAPMASAGGANNAGGTGGAGAVPGVDAASGAGAASGVDTVAASGVGAASGAGAAAFALRTAIIQDASWNIAAAHISERLPGEGMSDPSLAPIGKTTSGKRSMALYRFPLPAGVAAEDVVSARFCIRLKSGNEPKLAARPVGAGWTPTSCWDDVAPYMPEGAPGAVSEPAGDGWHKIDVTGMAKSWLSGEINNNGLAIEETQAGRLALYYSSYNNDGADCPKLEISYAEPLGGAGLGGATLGGADPSDAGFGSGEPAAPAGAGATLTATAGAGATAAAGAGAGTEDAAAAKAGSAAGSGAAVSVGTLAGGVRNGLGNGGGADGAQSGNLGNAGSLGDPPGGLGGAQDSLGEPPSNPVSASNLGELPGGLSSAGSLGDPPGGKFGKFGFEPQEDGNCMSYALRDLDAIAYGDLIDDTRAFQAAYDAGGADAALQYAKRQAMAYVERHKAALLIESFREIDGFQAAIDADAEYRIAMRAGFRDRDARPGIQVDTDFDYHFMLQVSDGSWAEKMPGEPSRLAPGSNHALDPGRHPWTQGYVWGHLKRNDYYAGDTAYFAVKKASAAFTEHKKAAARPVT